MASKQHIATGFFQGAQIVARYMEERVNPLLKGLLQPSDREICLRGLFLRALCVMRSLAKLNQSTDFQTIVSCNRTLLEIVVDMILLHHDKTVKSARQMREWERSAKLQSAECLIAYFNRKGKPIPPEYKAHVEFVQREKVEIEQQRLSFWLNPKRPDRGRHPPRWTGHDDLLIDIREADRLQKTTLEEFYETQYRQLNWNVHGSGLTSIRFLQASDFDAICGIAYKCCSDLAMLCTEIILEDFGFTNLLPLKAEWDAIKISRGQVFLEQTRDYKT